MVRRKLSHKRPEEKSKKPYVIISSYKKDKDIAPRWIEFRTSDPQEAKAHIAHIMGTGEVREYTRISEDAALMSEDGAIRLYVASNRLHELDKVKVDPDDYTPTSDIDYLLHGPKPKQIRKEWQDEKPTKHTRRERTGKHSNSGSISANDIAERLGVAGSRIRGILRGLKIDKPYKWSEKEAEEIETLVKKKLR